MAVSAKQRMKSEYVHLEATYHFIPIAIETLGVVEEEGRNFFKDLGRRISDIIQEQQSHQYLLQRVTIEVKRGNATSILGHFVQGEKCGHVDHFI